MLNSLAILAVLLAVAQTPVPIPGQTTNHSAGNGGAIQQKSGKGKTPTQPMPSLASQNQPAPTKGNAGDQGTKEDGNTVAVSKLPTVSISKDWADKSYWGFSGLLVVVGGFQVWLLWHTLRTIKRQANTMDAQATEAKKSSAETLAAIKEQNDNLLISAKAATVMAMASNKSAKAALAQIEMMKDKERARIEIKTFGLELQRVGEEFWHIKTTIELRNVGAGRAYIRLGTGSIEVVGDGIPEPYSKSLDIVDGFIDPTSPVTESFYFFQPDDAPLPDCSQKIWNGEWQPRITGFVEYETVGTRFHRNFSYVWIGNGSPLNIGGMFRSTDEDFSPKTDEEKISFGYWLPNSIWMTGWSGDNEEYEMEPKKKTKKPRQNPA